MIQAIRDEDHQRLRKSLAVSFSEKSMKQMEPRVKGWARLLQTKLTERGDAAVDMVELFRCAVSPTMYSVHRDFSSADYRTRVESRRLNGTFGSD